MSRCSDFASSGTSGVPAIAFSRRVARACRRRGTGFEGERMPHRLLRFLVEQGSLTPIPLGRAFSATATGAAPRATHQCQCRHCSIIAERLAKHFPDRAVWYRAGRSRPCRWQNETVWFPVSGQLRRFGTHGLKKPQVAKMTTRFFGYQTARLAKGGVPNRPSCHEKIPKPAILPANARRRVPNFAFCQQMRDGGARVAALSILSWSFTVMVQYARLPKE